jgi:hypothetical protein
MLQNVQQAQNFVKLFCLEKRFGHTYEGCPHSGPVGDSPHCQFYRPQGRYTLVHLLDSLGDTGHIHGRPAIIIIFMMKKVMAGKTCDRKRTRRRMRRRRSRRRTRRRRSRRRTRTRRRRRRRSRRRKRRKRTATATTKGKQKAQLLRPRIKH